MAADLVVVNHHLFFADMALRDSGVAELLPSVDVAIFDEAHQLAEAGVQFLGTTLGSGQLIDFSRDLLAIGLQQARGLAPWQEISAACDRAARELRLACVGAIGEVRGSFKLRWDERSEQPAFGLALTQLERDMALAKDALELVVEVSPDFVKLADRAESLSALARRFAVPVAPRPGSLDRSVGASGAIGRVAAGHP